MNARAPETSIASAGEAERVIANLNIILDRLMETVEEETARTRERIEIERDNRVVGKDSEREAR